MTADQLPPELTTEPPPPPMVLETDLAGDEADEANDGARPPADRLAEAEGTL